HRTLADAGTAKARASAATVSFFMPNPPLDFRSTLRPFIERSIGALEPIQERENDRQSVDLVLLAINTVTYKSPCSQARLGLPSIKWGWCWMPRRSPYEIHLSDDQRAWLESLARKYTSPY